MRLGGGGQHAATHAVVDGDAGRHEREHAVGDLGHELSVLQEAPQLDLVDVLQGACGGGRQCQHATG